jgi:hypothetical protein
MHRERVARLGAIDVKRPGLRIEVRKFADPRDKVARPADPAREAVLGPQFQDGPRRDPRDGRSSAERLGELPGRRPERQHLRLSHGAASREAAVATTDGSPPWRRRAHRGKLRLG